MKTLFYFFFTCYSFLAAFGQSYFDLIRIDHDYGLPVRYTDGKKSTFTETTLDITLPIAIGQKTRLITGVNLERVHVSVAGDSVKTVYGTALKLGLSHRLSDAWVVNMILLPKFSTDFSSLSRQDFQQGLFLTFRKDISAERNFRFGCYANTELFGPLLVPVVGLYRKSGKTEFNMLLPLNADWNYALYDAIKVGARFNGIIKSYQLEGTNNDHLVKANNEIGPYVQVEKGNLVCWLQGGRSVGRNVRLYQDGERMDLAISAIKIGDDRTQLNQDFGDGWFAKVSMAYRIKI